MTYQRVIRRNGLDRATWPNPDDDPYVRNVPPDDDRNTLSMGGLWALAGDLRRLEQDQRDEWHLARYAEKAGITPEQVKTVLDAFFDSWGIGT